MIETIVNIFLVIEHGFVVSFRAKSYRIDGSDEEKIKFLKRKAKEDFENAMIFDAPINSKGQFMKYSKFAKLENEGMQYQLFEEIFQKFGLPQNPLICVTPIVDGKNLGQ
ncbi:hypothetical protein ABRY23_08735 [Melioribacteraceae bacterium 4301-Me]|uniref:hypothetical protein n=1 Tax=Pyranulibacter aquaticus TaxID=3163344 RepID=UPI00359ACF75